MWNIEHLWFSEDDNVQALAHSLLQSWRQPDTGISLGGIAIITKRLVITVCLCCARCGVHPKSSWIQHWAFKGLAGAGEGARAFFSENPVLLARIFRTTCWNFLGYLEARYGNIVTGRCEISRGRVSLRHSIIRGWGKVCHCVGFFWASFKQTDAHSFSWACTSGNSQFLSPSVWLCPTHKTEKNGIDLSYTLCIRIYKYICVRLSHTSGSFG